MLMQVFLKSLDVQPAEEVSVHPPEAGRRWFPRRGAER